MWRRYGDVLYAGILLVVFAAEAGALGALGWAFLQGLHTTLPAASVEVLILGALMVTALALLLVSGFVLGYHAVSERWERLRAASMDAWTERWVDVVLRGNRAPSGPLPRTAVDALLDLGEVLSGEERDEVEKLATRYRIGEQLLGKVHRPGRDEQPSGGRRLRPPSTRRLARRLEALEGLAKARLPQAFQPLLRLLEHSDARIRLMALRAVARTFPRLPTEAARQRGARELVERLRVVRLPRGAIEECLLLLDEAAPVVLREALRNPQASPTVEAEGRFADGRRLRRLRWAPGEARSLLRAALDAAGRLKALALVHVIAGFVEHEEPEVRAAAVRALRHIGYVPRKAQAGVLRALRDEAPFLRTQAAHASALLPPDRAVPELWRLLGDESWWVRRAAAAALSRMAGRGAGELHRAVREHPDRYARHIAVQILMEAGQLEPEEARRVRAAG